MDYGNRLHRFTADEAITALRKGRELLKFGRRGKPHNVSFKLTLERTGWHLVWHSSGKGRTIALSTVTEIRQGQFTSIFQRQPKPEVQHISFSLMYDNGTRSLDVVCRNEEDMDLWLTGLEAVTANRRRAYRLYPNEPDDTMSIASTTSSTNSLMAAEHAARTNPLFPLSKTNSIASAMSLDLKTSRLSQDLTKVMGSVKGTPTAAQAQEHSQSQSALLHPPAPGGLADLLCWGEGMNGRTDDGTPVDAMSPVPVVDMAALDVRTIACGSWHSAVVANNGELFTWGDTRGPFHGLGGPCEASTPQIVPIPGLALSGATSALIACGAHHTAMVTGFGELYTWGDGASGTGVLGHGTDSNQWLPKLVRHSLDNVRVLDISCGLWHTALAADTGAVYTWGEGFYGALGHGDRRSAFRPRQIMSLASNGVRGRQIACGLWHTAVVAMEDGHNGGVLYTWGDGGSGKLGHGKSEDVLTPQRVEALWQHAVRQVACGRQHTVAVVWTGQVYAWGSNEYGQLGLGEDATTMRSTKHNTPQLVGGHLEGRIVRSVAAGDDHSAAVAEKGAQSSVFTWGCGANGRLGHGDTKDRMKPERVLGLGDRYILQVVCGGSMTTVVCRHQTLVNAAVGVGGPGGEEKCTKCRTKYGITKRPHTCYNCGQSFCKDCLPHRILNAPLAPNSLRPSRTCDSCFKNLFGESTPLQHTQSSRFSRFQFDKLKNIPRAPNPLEQLARAQSTISSLGSATRPPSPHASGLNTSASAPMSMFATQVNNALMEKPKAPAVPLPLGGCINPGQPTGIPPMSSFARSFVTAGFMHVIPRGATRPRQSRMSHSTFGGIESPSPGSTPPGSALHRSMSGESIDPFSASPSSSRSAMSSLLLRRTATRQPGQPIGDNDLIEAILKRVHNDGATYDRALEQTEMRGARASFRRRNTIKLPADAAQKLADRAAAITPPVSDFEGHEDTSSGSSSGSDDEDAEVVVTTARIKQLSSEDVIPAMAADVSRSPSGKSSTEQQLRDLQRQFEVAQREAQRLQAELARAQARLEGRERGRSISPVKGADAPEGAGAGLTRQESLRRAQVMNRVDSMRRADSMRRSQYIDVPEPPVNGTTSPTAGSDGGSGSKGRSLTVVDVDSSEQPEQPGVKDGIVLSPRLQAKVRGFKYPEEDNEDGTPKLWNKKEAKVASPTGMSRSSEGSAAATATTPSKLAVGGSPDVQTTAVEWTVQVDEGVIMTVARAMGPQGSAKNVLRGLDFSREIFKGDAQAWWEANRVGVLRRLEDATPPASPSAVRLVPETEVAPPSVQQEKASVTAATPLNPNRTSVHVFTGPAQAVGLKGSQGRPSPLQPGLMLRPPSQ